MEFYSKKTLLESAGENFEEAEEFVNGFLEGASHALRIKTAVNQIWPVIIDSIDIVGVDSDYVPGSNAAKVVFRIDLDMKSKDENEDIMKGFVQILDAIAQEYSSSNEVPIEVPND